MPPMRSKSTLATVPFPEANVPLDNAENIKCTIPFLHQSTSHGGNILAHLNQLRLKKKFCDVEVVAGNRVIKAHRVVLSASSPYFEAMFSAGLVEEQKDSIQIHCIPSNTLQEIVDFIYTGQLSVTQENVQDLIVAADMLELKEVVLGCTKFLKRELHVSNAFGIYRFAKDHNCSELADLAKSLIDLNFPRMMSQEEFCELPKETLYEFLASEQLRVDSEYQVLQGVMRWINYDLPTRKRYVFELLSYIRLPLISLILLDRAIMDCSDASLKVALKSIRMDLVLKKGNLVPLVAYPRLNARKSIYVIGGNKKEMLNSFVKSFECTYDTVERYDSFSGEWCKGVAPMEIGRVLPGVAALNGMIYVAGGEHESHIVANGEVYDPYTNSWSPVASMVVPRCEFGLCAFEGDLYALGGWVGDDIGDTIERYDPVLDEWKLLTNKLPEPRFSMGVVSYEGLIYIVGGCTHTRRHMRDLISFNPVTGEWSVLAPMLEPRSQTGVAVLDGHLYVVGGVNKNRSVLRSVEKYSFESNKWSYAGMLKVGRASPAVAAAAGSLYVIGGYETDDINFFKAQITISSVEQYDPIRNVWDEAPSLPDSRSEAAAVVL